MQRRRVAHGDAFIKTFIEIGHALEAPQRILGVDRLEKFLGAF